MNLPNCNLTVSYLVVRTEQNDLIADYSSQVIEHVEGWNVSGLVAIGQMFKASERSKWRAPGS